MTLSRKVVQSLFALCIVLVMTNRAPDSFASATIVAGGSTGYKSILADTVYDKLRGAWIGQLIGNFTGLPTELRYRENPNPASSIDLVTYQTWVTDDDTSMEWVFLHMLEEH